MIEYIATNLETDEFKILADEPVLTIEEVRVAMPDDAEAYISGHYSWNRLTTGANLEPLIDGMPFVMTASVSDVTGYQWVLEDCYVCADKKSIFFKNAKQVKV